MTMLKIDYMANRPELQLLGIIPAKVLQHGIEIKNDEKMVKKSIDAKIHWFEFEKLAMQANCTESNLNKCTFHFETGKSSTWRIKANPEMIAYARKKNAYVSCRIVYTLIKTDPLFIFMNENM